MSDLHLPPRGLLVVIIVAVVGIIGWSQYVTRQPWFSAGENYLIVVPTLVIVLGVVIFARSRRV